MSTTLADALKQLDLQPGETRLVTVNGYRVEVRRLPEEATPDIADQSMLEPWAKFPPSRAARIVTVRRGAASWPRPLKLDESDLTPGDLPDA